jgi:hypothetical protein
MQLKSLPEGIRRQIALDIMPTSDDSIASTAETLDGTILRIALILDGNCQDVMRWVEGLEDEFEPIISGFDEEDENKDERIFAARTSSICNNKEENQKDDQDELHPIDDTTSIDKMSQSTSRPRDQSLMVVSRTIIEIPDEQTNVLPALATPITDEETTKHISAMEESYSVTINATRTPTASEDGWNDLNTLSHQSITHECILPISSLIKAPDPTPYMYSSKTDRWVINSERKSPVEFVGERDPNSHCSRKHNNDAHIISNNEEVLAGHIRGDQYESCHAGYADTRVINWVRECQKPILENDLMGDTAKLHGISLA